MTQRLPEDLLTAPGCSPKTSVIGLESLGSSHLARQPREWTVRHRPYRTGRPTGLDPPPATPQARLPLPRLGPSSERFVSRGTARRDFLPWRVPYFCPVRWSVSAVVCVCGRGAFGEIALPRRCLGKVGFSATPGILAVVDIFKLRIIVWQSSHHPLSHCKQRGTQGFPLVPGQPPGHSHGR